MPGWFVDTENGDDADGGTSLSTAFASLRRAFDVARAGETIHVTAPGKVGLLNVAFTVAGPGAVEPPVDPDPPIEPPVVWPPDPIPGIDLPPQDAEGWTIIPPLGDGIAYHVAADGDDANTGLYPDMPLATIQAAYDRLRGGYPDRLLLRRGDAFEIDRGVNRWKNGGGRSALEPMIVMGYGVGARPRIIHTGPVFNNANTQPFSDVWWIGLDMERSPNVTSGAAFSISGAPTRLLIEDCRWKYGGASIQPYAPKGDHVTNRGRDVWLRRNVVLNCFNIESHGQGLFVKRCDNLLIEECVFDHNGWSEAPDPVRTADKFVHNVYLASTNGPAVVRNNLVLRGSGMGVHFRSGGLLAGNFFRDNYNAFGFGYQADSGAPIVTGKCIGNVVQGGRNQYGLDPRAMISINSDGVEFARNLFCNAGETVGGGVAIGSSVANGPTKNAHVHGNIIYKWGERSTFQMTNDQYEACVFEENDVQGPGSEGAPIKQRDAGAMKDWAFGGNRYWTDRDPAVRYRIDGVEMDFVAYQVHTGDTTSVEERVEYPNPDGRIEEYAASIGLDPTFDAFLAEVAEQRRGNWRTEFTAQSVCAWFRANFGMAAP